MRIINSIFLLSFFALAMTSCSLDSAQMADDELYITTATEANPADPPVDPPTDSPSDPPSEGAGEEEELEPVG